MEIHGVCVDVERWRDLLANRKTKGSVEVQIKQTLGEALARTHPTQETLFGETILPTVHLTSSEQLIHALRALGVYVTSTSKETLQDVEHQHPVIAHPVGMEGVREVRERFW